MTIIEIVLIGIGLAMDALAVSVCKGLLMNKMSIHKAIKIGLYFGVFQAIMPLIGYLLGETFEDLVVKIDHWIAFILLGSIGGNMVIDALKNKEIEANEDIAVKTMCVLAIATSIDALAVGITLAFFEVNILKVVFIIGMITFVLSVLGVKIGNKFGSKYERKAKVVGGVILIIMGINILLKHLGVI